MVGFDINTSWVTGLTLKRAFAALLIGGEEESEVCLIAKALLKINALFSYLNLMGRAAYSALPLQSSFNGFYSGRGLFCFASNPP